MTRLFSSTIAFTRDRRKAGACLDDGFRVSRTTHLWWNPADPGQCVSWRSRIKLSSGFFECIVDRPVPIDLRAVRALRSPFALDVYAWLTYRMQGRFSGDLGKKLLNKSNNMEFRCGGGECDKRKNLFGYTYRNADYLYLCDLAFSSSQSRMNAVVFHELSHTAGADENTAEACENRCYEGRGATKPTKGESCDDCN